ncbi:MAG: hypothetical protein K2X98_06815, partial [Alphaproteobacteria bacterium]|nr:hypothetical protein [Alphaproteobacteria bacterium]
LSKEIQQEAGNLRDFGVRILQGLLKKLHFEQKHWFDGTGGSACGHGSYNLSFNYYNADIKDKPFGIGEHTDWGMITLLDTIQPGLQIRIDNQWRDISVDDDDLIVNIGEPFTYLLSHVKPGIHRVVNQDVGVRTSIAMFINPRIGPFKESAKRKGQEGMIYSYNPEKNMLVDGITVVDYFENVSNQLLGTKI